MNISWKCTQIQAMQDVDEIVSSLEQISINVVLHDLLTNGTVNGCRQNESPNSWIITIIHKIHTTPVHQLTSCEDVFHK